MGMKSYHVLTDILNKFCWILKNLLTFCFRRRVLFWPICWIWPEKLL